ncbi:MAG TPA: hypothetical protein VMY39_10240 [Planctomycetota bacterium]|nr:hypothetical protein [Planctomycetota bacterium]
MTGGPKQSVLIRKLQFHYEYALFITLSLLVVFVKFVQQTQAGASTDPAVWWHLGKAGYVAVNVVLMLGVVGLCEVVARRHRSTARLVLWFAIAVLAALVVLSGLQYYETLRRGTGRL